MCRAFVGVERERTTGTRRTEFLLPRTIDHCLRATLIIADDDSGRRRTINDAITNLYACTTDLSECMPAPARPTVRRPARRRRTSINSPLRRRRRRLGVAQEPTRATSDARIRRSLLTAQRRQQDQPLQYYCNTLPISYFIHQRRLTFWYKIQNSNNIVLRTLSSLKHYSFVAIAAKYGTNSHNVFFQKCGLADFLFCSTC